MHLLPPLFATAQQAYQDYQYQYDVYRQTYSDFQVAKNQYQKFGSLESQSAALAKSKTMLTQRDQLLRSYLVLLNEKLAEAGGISTSTKQLYQTLLQNEITFLDNNAQLIPSTGSIDDVVRVSGELETHYSVLQVTIRQIQIGLALGQVTVLSKYYDTALSDAKTLITNYSGAFTPDKQQTINRWLLEIDNKRSLYQQKYDLLMQTNQALSSEDSSQLDQNYNSESQGILEARQYLLEGASYLGELKNAMMYTN